MSKRYPTASDYVQDLGANIGHESIVDTDLSVGDINFNPPAYFRSAVADTIDGQPFEPGLARDTHKYASEAGLPELRESIADVWGRNDRLTAQLPIGRTADGDPSVVVTCGGQTAIYIAIKSVLDPGQKALLFSPYYPYHRQAAELTARDEAGAQTIETTAANGFEPDLEAVRDVLESEDVGALVLCNPGNPTGATYSEEYLAALAALCREYDDLWVVSDEVYAFMTYDGHPARSISTFEGMADRTIVIGSFSKLVGISGWRLGFLAVPPQLFETVERLNDNLTIHPPTITQRVLDTALRDAGGFPHLAEWMNRLDRRREIISKPFVDHDAFTVHDPDGAFYLLPQVGAEVLDGQDVTSFGGYDRASSVLSSVDRRVTVGDCLKWHLVDAADVQVVEGVAFGTPAAIRLAYGNTSINELNRAADRIETALETFC